MIGTHKVEIVTATQPDTTALLSSDARVMLLMKKPISDTARNFKNDPFCPNVKWR